MQIALDYGKTGLTVEIPDANLVGPLGLRSVAPLADPQGALAAALKQPIGTAPLCDLARGKKSACVLICDITRPVPNALLLPPILQTLEAAGVPREGILILIATGLHRPNLGAELVELVGSEVAGAYRIELRLRDARDARQHLRGCVHGEGSRG